MKSGVKSDNSLVWLLLDNSDTLTCYQKRSDVFVSIEQNNIDELVVSFLTKKLIPILRVDFNSIEGYRGGVDISYLCYNPLEYKTYAEEIRNEMNSIKQNFDLLSVDLENYISNEKEVMKFKDYNHKTKMINQLFFLDKFSLVNGGENNIFLTKDDRYIKFRIKNRYGKIHAKKYNVTLKFSQQLQ